ncbi:hypothetical protein [Arthrobacter tumbae]|uniref:hypothetical protein n=1 Tax=Arthrobacter tumbae TaxID=163874 RepID=UPI001956107C|nr:hypothetical protein [Arthrobacter tumbae]MBM7780554.1 hypothetical protein [Arthrobacter tumbae]
MTFLFLAGCAAPSASEVETVVGASTADANEMIGAAEMPEARRQAIEQFPEELPAGYVWPAGNAVAPAAAGQDVVAEVGVADTSIAEFWLCAWTAEYIEASDTGDTADAHSALSEIEKYTSLPAVVAHHQNPEVFDSAVVDTAYEGDSTNLRNFFKSCGVLNH